MINLLAKDGASGLLFPSTSLRLPSSGRRTGAFEDFDVHAIRIFDEDGVGAAAEVHNLTVGRNDVSAGCLELSNHAFEVDHLDRHRRCAGVADPQVKTGARHTAKFSELDIGG